MSTKIKNATLISTVSDTIKIPLGNYEDDSNPYALTVGQLKSHIDSDKATVATTGSYDDLLNKPDLNNYALVSTLNSNYYNKTEVDNITSQIHGVDFVFVDSLPQRGQSGIVYLVKDNVHRETLNLFDEFIWLPDYNTYERIGDEQPDLTNYYTKSQVDNLIPSVSNAQITITQGGVTKGSFRLNQNGAGTINIDSFTQVQTDWSVTDQSDPKYIWHKPTIPSVGNGIGDGRIKLVCGGVELGSFTTNQNNNTTITIPQGNQVQVDWNETDTTSPKYIKNKPTIPTVNNPTIYFTQGGVTRGSITLNQSGNATIAFDAGGGGGGSTQVQANWADNDPTSMAFIQNKPSLATVASTGSYNDLTDRPAIPTATQSDWAETDTSNVAYIQNKPTLSAVATTGSYNDLSNTPSLATVATTGDYSDLNNTPSLSLVATSGSYADLTNKPNFSTVATSGDYTDLNNTPSLSLVATSGSYSDLTNKPNFSTVATSGSYNDLTDTPTIPAAQVNSDWNAVAGVAQILNKPTLSAVATSGSYTDLSNTPNFANVATSGDYTDLSNTPNLAPVATSGSYVDLTNKPTIPTNTRALLITYEDNTTEVLTVYTT